MEKIKIIPPSETQPLGTARLSSRPYVKQEPYIDNEGIWIPVQEYIPEGYASTYKCLITKELFVEAFNKWIGELKPEKTIPEISNNYKTPDCEATEDTDWNKVFNLVYKEPQF